MADHTDVGDFFLSPDEAFGVLGNETRMKMLQILGEAEQPLLFSELREQLEIDDPGQVNYHLNQLKGHFVRQTDDGYKLLQPGHRVIQAVVSGGVTGTPVLEPTEVDAPCPYCGQSVEISYGGERLLIRCTECAGTFAGSETDAPFVDTHPYGSIGAIILPPAGVTGRSPPEILEAVIVWTLTEYLALESGICPRCSMTIERTLRVCEDHDSAGGNCDVCNTRHAVHVDYDCPHCTHQELIVPAGFHLFLSVPELMSFLSAREIIPVIPSWETTVPMLDYQDEVINMDPTELQFTYTADGDKLILVVDEKFDVIDSTVITGLSE